MVLIMVLALFVGCVSVTPDIVDPVETLSADVEIINWVQGIDTFTVKYEITNTGTVDIAYYKLKFEVTYVDDSVYTIWHEKVGIAVGSDEIVEVIIEVSDEVARVDIVDLKLTEWKW